MHWWQRWRADLSRPEVPTGREELAFLTGSALAMIAVAQWTDPGTTAELLGLTPALLAFVARGLVSRLLAEVFTLGALVPVALVVGNAGNLEPAFFLSVIGTLYAAWHLRSTTRAVLILAASAATPWLVAQHLAPESNIAWTAWTMANLFTFSLGRVLGRQRELIAQLEAAREALAEQAVAEERRRIARELHDLAGHTLAAVLLHVTGARHVLRRDIGEAERALREAEAVGRSSLDQIRATVAALRTDERGTDRALASSSDLAALVEEYRRAGLRIDATLPSPGAALDGPVGTALHRIAREALANVARHAPTNDVELAIDVTDDAAMVTVTDRGRPAPPPADDAGHFGLVGMRERARALGGDLHAGPTTDGWRVAGHVPLVAADRPAATPRPAEARP